MADMTEKQWQTLLKKVRRLRSEGHSWADLRQDGVLTSGNGPTGVRRVRAALGESKSAPKSRKTAKASGKKSTSRNPKGRKTTAEKPRRKRSEADKAADRKMNDATLAKTKKSIAKAKKAAK